MGANLSSESWDYVDTKISVSEPHGTPRWSLFEREIFWNRFGWKFYHRCRLYWI